jgi:hypothetical protein
MAGEPGVGGIADSDQSGRTMDDNRELLTPCVTRADLGPLAQVREPDRGCGGAEPELSPVEQAVDRGDARLAGPANGRQVQDLDPWQQRPQLVSRNAPLGDEDAAQMIARPRLAAIEQIA